jgi:hypothetical protein
MVPETSGTVHPQKIKSTAGSDIARFGSRLANVIVNRGMIASAFLT